LEYSFPGSVDGVEHDVSKVKKEALRRIIERIDSLFRWEGKEYFIAGSLLEIKDTNFHQKTFALPRASATAIITQLPASLETIQKPEYLLPEWKE
jgi:hypothetical protein